jgi:hypothetical protein
MKHSCFSHNITYETMKNPQLYEASLEVLTTAGCPQDLAQKVSEIVANDGSNEPNLGRTQEEQNTVNAAVRYLQEN